jgi:hypothetical protein
MGDVEPCIFQGLRANKPEINGVELESTRNGNVYA